MSNDDLRGLVRTALRDYERWDEAEADVAAVYARGEAMPVRNGQPGDVWGNPQDVINEMAEANLFRTDVEDVPAGLWDAIREWVEINRKVANEWSQS